MERARNRIPPEPPPEGDAPLLVGGPGDGETVPAPAAPSESRSTPLAAAEDAPPPGEPAGTQVTIAGRSFTVDPGVAEALQQQQQHFDARFGDLSSRYARLESAVVPRAQPEPYDYDTQLFAKPSEALQRLKYEIMSELTGQYAQDQQQRQWWESFYRTHQDLADAPRLVEAVARDLFPRWAHQPAERAGEFAEEVAKHTRQEILRLTRKHREADAPTTARPAGRAVVEGASRGRTPTPQPDEGPTSIAELLQRRKAERRRAMRAVEGG